MRLRAVIAALIVALVTPVSVALAQTWSAYQPEGLGYTVEMPGQWTLEAKDVPTDIGPIKMQMATVDLQSQVYMSIYSVFPQSHIDKTPAETMLNNARDGAVKNVQGTLLTEDRLTIGGFPARHITVDTPQARVSQRLILANTRLLQAIFVGPVDAEKAPDVVRFFKSFDVTGPLSPAATPAP